MIYVRHALSSRLLSDREWRLRREPHLQLQSGLIPASRVAAPHDSSYKHMIFNNLLFCQENLTWADRAALGGCSFSAAGVLLSSQICNPSEQLSGAGHCRRRRELCKPPWLSYRGRSCSNLSHAHCRRCLFPLALADPVGPEKTAHFFLPPGRQFVIIGSKAPEIRAVQNVGRSGQGVNCVNFARARRRLHLGHSGRCARARSGETPRLSLGVQESTGYRPAS